MILNVLCPPTYSRSLVPVEAGSSHEYDQSDIFGSSATYHVQKYRFLSILPFCVWSHLSILITAPQLCSIPSYSSARFLGPNVKGKMISV